MQEQASIENYEYEYLGKTDIKKIGDKLLLDKVQNTYKFLQLSEIYLSDVKDDYGKKKIAGLRVDFIRYQLELLIKECFVRGLNHGLNI